MTCKVIVDFVKQNSAKIWGQSDLQNWNFLGSTVNVEVGGLQATANFGP